MLKDLFSKEEIDEFNKNMNEWHLKVYGESIEQMDKRIEKWWNDNPEISTGAKIWSEEIVGKDDI